MRFSLVHRVLVVSLTLASLFCIAAIVSGLWQPFSFSSTLRTTFIPQVSSSATYSADAAYVDTFDGQPTSVQAWQPDDWDVTVHSRDAATWQALDPVAAHHGSDCAAPPASHNVTAYEDAVFLCRDHLMTALNAEDYGLIYLTPNHLVDFGSGEAVVRFDLSTFRTSERDWIDLWITPFEDHLQLPLEDWLPDLQGEPRNAIQIRMGTGYTGTIFTANVVRDFVAEQLPEANPEGYETFLQPDAKRRDTFELRVSKTHIKFGMPDYNVWWVDADIDELGWDSGIVQFGHHSYNPTKCDGCAGANTWHWDNVQISPATPFTMIHADRRFVDDRNAVQVNFNRAAPDDSKLRFAAFGDNIEVSFDEGASWSPAQKQAQERDDSWHFRSYWTPIPEGTASVRFRGQGIANYGWYVRDISVWSRGADS